MWTVLRWFTVCSKRKGVCDLLNICQFHKKHPALGICSPVYSVLFYFMKFCCNDVSVLRPQKKFSCFEVVFLLEAFLHPAYYYFLPAPSELSTVPEHFLFAKDMTCLSQQIFCIKRVANHGSRKHNSLSGFIQRVPFCSLSIMEEYV